MKLNSTNYHFSLPLVLVVSLSLLLSVLGLPKAVRNSQLFILMRDRLKPTIVSLVKPLTFVDSVAANYADRQWLTRAYLKSQAELINLAHLKAENQDLRSLLKVKDSLEQTNLIVKPVYSPTQPLIAAGQMEGVKRGSLVFGHGVLLGIVSQVEPHLARVRLLNQDHHLVLLAKTKSGVTGLVQLIDGQLRLTEIPPNLKVMLNEPVITIGQPGIPGGLLIGLVAETGKMTAEPTYSVKLKQGISFYSEAIVQVKP